MVSSHGFSTKTQCSVLWSSVVVKENERRGERERARARGREREVQRNCCVAGRGWAGGNAPGEVEEFSAIPLCEQKIYLYSVFLFFFPYRLFSSQSRYLPMYALLHFFLFAASVCACVCFTGGQLFCRGIAKHHELVI